MKKILISLFSLFTLSLLTSCSQDSPQSIQTSQQQAPLSTRPLEAGKVRFIIDASLGTDRQRGRTITLSGPGSFKDKSYPHIIGYEGSTTLVTHAFLFALDETTNKYTLEGYTKLSWEITSGGSSDKHKALLKLSQDNDVWKASYSSDASKVEISTTDKVSIPQGKTYRLLAINADGGFDVNKPDATLYPEGKAPMFYFGKGGNSPLESLSVKNHQGLIPYVLELDIQTTKANTFEAMGTTPTGYRPAIFYPASPLLEVTVVREPGQLDLPTEMPTFSDLLNSQLAIASSCLTQKYGYTITGVDEAGSKPSFSVVLKRLEAEHLARRNSDNPLSRTTYELLLLPKGLFSNPAKDSRYPDLGDAFTFYLPLELRFKSISSMEDMAVFYLDNGTTVEGFLVEENDLILWTYLTEKNSPNAITQSPADGQLGTPYLTFHRGEFKGNQQTSSQYRFNLNLAKGEDEADQGDALEKFWRNSRSTTKGRSNINRLILHIGQIQGAAATNEL